VDIAAVGPGGETFTQPEELLVITTFGPRPGSGSITIHGAAGNMCNGNLIGLSRVESFFDANQNGIVDGVRGDRARGSYPHTIEFRQNADLFLPPERFVFDSASFGRNLAGNLAGNLVIAGYFNNCRTQQFVAFHLFVSEQNGTVRIDPVTLVAGDRITFVNGAEGGRGAILSVIPGDVQLDAAQVKRGRAVGTVSGTVVFVDPGRNQTFGANVAFSFDAPIEQR
jgi:hypothetical protein